MKLDALREPLQRAIGDGAHPVAVFSATWPVARALRTPVDRFLPDLHGLLAELVGDRTLLMPAFPGGFQDGHCDLDAAPSTTGAWSEHFRVLPDTERTLDAFFAFAVAGPDTPALLALRPEQAWGRGSLYEWLHVRNARIVTVGLHPTHCSFSHRAEWLARDTIDYRHDKVLGGEVTWRGERFTHEQTLFVRDLDRDVTNDFTKYLDAYRQAGMVDDTVDGVVVSGIGAALKMDVLGAAIRQNPEAVLNPAETTT